ncbi:lipocalin family protein [Marinobacter similis]|uniref:lipocalin family protein n=1 Tax=Marinobacter similis TaxID=1420916 RepID=UPI002E7FFD73|nr:lipocalin family protein [Marinobacter similis]
MMAFRLRENSDVFTSGTWITDEGKAVSLSADDLILAPDADAEATPTRWRLQVPRYGVDLDIAAPPGNYRNEGQYPYWESPVSVSGSHSGEGYMELTGYEAE